MLKDVGMTVPKSRETSADIAICSNTGEEGSIFICSKTGDEGSIYAARQEMRECRGECNNNNMCNPIITHVIIVTLNFIVNICVDALAFHYLHKLFVDSMDIQNLLRA